MTPPRRIAAAGLCVFFLPPQKGGRAERRRAASVAQNWAAIRRPAYAAILQPSAPLTRAVPLNQGEADDLRVPPKACGWRTPEAGPLSSRRHQARAHRAARVRSAGTSGAASLVPRYRRSAARVLMDEGWVEFNAGQRAEDKWCAQSRVIPAQAGIQLARDARNKNWTPAFAGLTRMLRRGSRCWRRGQ